jgi:hypothetical protein
VINHRRSSLFENLFMGTIHISFLSSNILLIIINDVVSKIDVLFRTVF